MPNYVCRERQTPPPPCVPSHTLPQKTERMGARLWPAGAPAAPLAAPTHPRAKKTVEIHARCVLRPAKLQCSPPEVSRSKQGTRLHSPAFVKTLSSRLSCGGPAGPPSPRARREGERAGAARPWLHPTGPHPPQLFRYFSSLMNRNRTHPKPSPPRPPCRGTAPHRTARPQQAPRQVRRRCPPPAMQAGGRGRPRPHASHACMRPTPSRRAPAWPCCV